MRTTNELLAPKSTDLNKLLNVLIVKPILVKVQYYDITVKISQLHYWSTEVLK